MTIALPEIGELDMESVLENSYKDFHCKGFDYICLKRSPEYTLKAYFFEGDAQDASEVVNPHDHRYDFRTTCLSGEVTNKWFRVPPRWEGQSTGDKHGSMYNVFHYTTPLNGGSGFDLQGLVPLQIYQTRSVGRGGSYFMGFSEFHTIQITKPDTVLLLEQYTDEVPVGQPTLTFTQSAEPPNLSGLYNKFTADQAVKRIQQLHELDKP
ncbi:hypothetical protein [Mycobacteroides chelonae]|uniref:hypothetical protein n=1 Tax=Mycobacteroides chelonae TaxID=1774 RepID=UPI0008A93DAC|nr:hypothetical protein [Mycobacteroides chelonae]OHU64016.1 hypothetical protein BKG85_11320 [Mycobacteroides chelonae]